MPHLANAADVLIARFLVEAEVLVETEADVIAVQAVAKLLQVEKVLLKRACYSGLSERADGNIMSERAR